MTNHHLCSCIGRFSKVLTLVTVLSSEATGALALVTTNNIRALGTIFAGFVNVANVAVYRDMKVKTILVTYEKLVYSVKLI